MTTSTSFPPATIHLSSRRIGTASYHQEHDFSATELAAWSRLSAAKIQTLVMDGWLVTRKGPYQRPRITWESAHKLLGETCWWPHSAEEASSRFSIRVKEAAVLLQVPHSTLSSKLNENEVVPIKRLGRFTLLRPVDLPMIRKWMENTVPIPKQLSPEAQVVHSVEAAHLLGVVHSLVYYWIKRGMLSARRSGNGSRLYVSKEAVLQLKQVFDEHRAKHISPPQRIKGGYSDVVRAAFGLPPVRRGPQKR
jgi:hypothetical protein